MDTRSLRDWWMPVTLRFEDIFGGQTPSARPLGHTLYFSAQPTSAAISRLKQRLSEQRTRELIPLSNVRLLNAFDGLARRWLDPLSPERRRYLAIAEAMSGAAVPLLSARLDASLQALRAHALEQRLSSVYGPLEPLEDFWELKGQGVRLRRYGPSLVGVRAQGLPELALLALVRALCVRSAVLVQADSETGVLLSLLLQSLAQLEKGLAESVAVTGPVQGSDEQAQRVWLDDILHLTTWGSDDELKRLLRLAPALPAQPLGRARSVTVLLRSGLQAGEGLKALSRGIVRDVLLGTPEPGYAGNLIFVEQNATVTPEQVAQALSEALVEQAQHIPPTRMSDTQLARQRSTLSLLQVHHAQQSLVLVPPQPGPEGLVVLVPPGGPEVELAPRWIKLVPFRHRPELLPWLARIPALHTVALAGEGLPAQLLREDLVRQGVKLFCVPGQRFNAPYIWHRLEGLALPLYTIEEELSLSLEEVEDLELAELDMDADEADAEPSLNPRPAHSTSHLSPRGGRAEPSPTEAHPTNIVAREDAPPAPAPGHAQVESLPTLSAPSPGRPRRPAWQPEDDEDDDDARESRTVVITVAELERSFSQAPGVAQTGSHQRFAFPVESSEKSLPEGFAMTPRRPSLLPVASGIRAHDDEQVLLKEALRVSGQERLEQPDETLVLTLPPDVMRTLEQGARAFVLPVPSEKGIENGEDTPPERSWP